MSDLDRALSGFRYVEIQNGDTLQGIAARELKDAARWADLITINGLTYPYLTGDPDAAGPTVKLYGDLLIVPASSIQITAVADPNEVYKIDIALNKGRVDADEFGDFAVVAGRDNYKQAIENVVSTPKKELLFHLDYGCDVEKLKGVVNGPTAALLGAEYVKSAIRADSRTDRVVSATAEVIGDALPITARVIPIAGTVVNISTEL